MSKHYTLRYLPLFEEDVAAARDYIAQELGSPAAAKRLVEDAEKAILQRLANPEAFERYHLAKERKHPYYRIQVRNFTVFYVVIDQVMEVRRFVYSRRDLTELV